ncbi:kelch repeat-containing protein [Polyangium sp. y55x31]|uniref:Kelch repeat-containing protein n=1 Tax=Polyangium sp. y55x31 TaxID=3042688 RepID=UPI0024826B5B|nr:kelch repeat-containing protein [Polyangium sp. y55x31]MDI1477088.1 kelch repeat-containing protein [Polyangium sp. y55x31]
MGATRQRPWGLVGVSAALVMLLGGCPDALTLGTEDPTGSGASGGAGPGGGGGSGGEGGAPTSCISNSDCPAPTAVCDTKKSTCVECLEIQDCAFRPGTVCSEGKCVCPNEGESFCGGPPRCVNLETSSQDCGKCGHACFGACTESKCADAWEPTPTQDAPAARSHHVAVWTGAKMIVWSGNTAGGTTNTGAMLDLGTGAWTPTSTANVPPPRTRAHAVWTGTHMVVWGGENGTPVKTGGVFNPISNTWSAMTTAGAPSPRSGHTMVWTGSKVIVWGGFDGTNYLGDGGAYDVTEDRWDPLPAGGTPPSPRSDHSAVWTGSDMIVFGGYGFNGVEVTYLGDGAEFDPGTGVWSAVKDGQPPARARHAAEWTGTEMIVWGGYDLLGPASIGARYKPKIEWSFMTTEGAPDLRQYHTAVWIAPRLIVWGGQNVDGTYLNTGSLYNPATNTWSAKPIPTAPVGRAHHTAISTGSKMVIWGGVTPGGGVTNTGGILDPSILP